MYLVFAYLLVQTIFPSLLDFHLSSLSLSFFFNFRLIQKPWPNQKRDVWMRWVLPFIYMYLEIILNTDVYIYFLFDTYLNWLEIPSGFNIIRCSQWKKGLAMAMHTYTNFAYYYICEFKFKQLHFVCKNNVYFYIILP